jgi:hypothetical protein
VPATCFSSSPVLTNVIFFLFFSPHLTDHNLKNMKRIKLGAGFTVFIIFFGLSMLDAFKTQNWWRVSFWLIIGVSFLVADNIRRARS